MVRLSPIFLISCFLLAAGAANNASEKRDRYAVDRSFREGDLVANVYDDALPQALADTLAQLLTSPHRQWQFLYPNEELGKPPINNGDVHWIYFFDPEFVKTSVIGSLCRNIFRRMNKGEKYYPREAYGTMLLRGMAPTLVENKEDADEMYVRIFLTSGMTKNDYGQLSMYTQDKDFVLGSVFPKYKRMVVFNGSIPFIMKPPAMGNAQAEYSIVMKWTKDHAKYEDGVKTYLERQAKRNSTNSVPFPRFFDLPNNNVYTAPKFDDHVTNIFYDQFGNHVAVFDDVLSNDELLELRRYLVQRDAALMYNGYANDESDDNDNVNWISGFEISEFVKSKLWNVVYDMSVYMSGRTGWYPYDVSLNTIQSAHHTRFHTDCMDDEFEYTFLLYLNPNWTPDMYGETMFTDHMKGFEAATGANQRYDVKAVVQAKYGRIAMFRNIINHSARPPSPNFLDSRYSFAVKVSINTRVAQAKTLLELMEFLTEEDEGYQLYEDLNSGVYNKVTTNEPPNFLIDNLAKFDELKQTRSVKVVADLKDGLVVAKKPH